MIVEGPRNHHTTFWPKQKSCQLAFNLTFFYPALNLIKRFILVQFHLFLFLLAFV
jgi:hypothetical protein